MKASLAIAVAICSLAIPHAAGAQSADTLAGSGTHPKGEGRGPDGLGRAPRGTVGNSGPSRDGVGPVGGNTAIRSGVAR